MQIRQAHFPGRAPIDAYGNGGFRFADMSHRGSILVLESGVYGWAPASAEEIDEAALGKVFAEEPPPEVLLVGTGRRLVPLDASVRQTLREHGVIAEVMDTGAAARTYNVLLAEQRSVGAALIAVE